SLSYASFRESPARLLALHSFPTRRSSDLPGFSAARGDAICAATLPSGAWAGAYRPRGLIAGGADRVVYGDGAGGSLWTSAAGKRSEEHTSELQSLTNLVCRLLLEKKKTRR